MNKLQVVTGYARRGIITRCGGELGKKYR